ncbi:MAG: sulfite exporter TauE/SafE family protein [Pyrinomonadaceae bacterium]
MLEPGTIIALLVAAAIFGLSLLHSSSGLGGAASYLAIMALLGMPLLVIKPTVLTLNIIVALICTVRFYRAGFFSWRSFWPFAVASVPASFVASLLPLPALVDRVAVGLILLYAAIRLFFSSVNSEQTKMSQVPILIALPLGAAIGFVSGIVGIGGGIILSPILFGRRWADADETRGVTVAFALVNSIAALIPRVEGILSLPDGFLYWAPAVIVGAWIGTELSDRGRFFLLRFGRFSSFVVAAAGVRLIV